MKEAVVRGLATDRGTLPIVRPAPSLLIACMLMGCTPRDPAPTTAPELAGSSESSSSEPAPDATPGGEPTPEPEPEPAGDASESLLWFEPLPALSLETPTEEQKARIRQCGEAHRVQEPDVTVLELMAAAECFGAIPMPGHEIRIYRHVLQNYPEAPQNVDAAREVGRRYEQIDVRPQAIDGYVAYLTRYPKQADARALGQRAVCLARSLGDGARADEILGELERFYGRRGFVRPDDAALDELCRGLEPVRAEGE